VKQHPLQPIITDEKGIRRFQKNEIVCFLLSKSGLDMNDLAILPFDAADRCQFAQLIGYSCGGYAELPYVSEEEWKRILEIAP
jgi:hypothetical protein